VSIENDDLNDSSSTRVSFQITDDNPADKLPCVNSRFLQFLKPDPIFHARPWVNSDSDGGKESTVGERGSGNGFQEMKPWPQGRHLVLEALARKKNSSSVYFLREFDFYDVRIQQVEIYSFSILNFILFYDKIILGGNCRNTRQASHKEGAWGATSVGCCGPTSHACTWCGVLIVNYKP
jgi:hypothetical protein